MDDYIAKVAVPQVKELLSNYGQVLFCGGTPSAADMTPERVGYAVAQAAMRR